jgi:putative salt-induced outer membrane protein YdiY
MKRDLPKSQSIFFRVAWLCVISFCLLVVGINVHAAQQVSPGVEREVDSSSTPSVPASDGEEIDSSTTETKNKTVKNQAWEPPPPPPDEFDWVQLTSGEWLKGKIKRLYDRKLEFDSKKLKLQEFDWKDVRQLRGPRIFGIRLTGPITVNGMLQITENKVIVTNEGDQQVFDRDRVFAIVPKAERRVKLWSGKMSFGFNFSEGNTDEMDYSAKANLKRRTSETRFVMDYLGNITQTNSVETINNHRLQGSYDLIKTRKIFYRPVFSEIYHDPFKNIKARVFLGIGAGYHIIDTPDTQWTVGGGPAYLTTRFDSVEPGENSSEWSPALAAGTNFDSELTKRIDFIFKYTFQILNEASGTYTHHSITTLETELTEWLDFDTSFVWDRTQDPTPEADGTVPEKDDFYFIFSLGIDF